MRKSFAFLLLLTSVSGFGQPYKLFNAVSKMVFTTFPVAGVTYNLAFDSADASGPDSVFYPYRLAEQDFSDSENCFFWGGPYCRHQTQPIWAGMRISASETGLYRFFNLSGDTLLFDTGTIPGQTSLLFQDQNQRFNLLSEAPDTMTVLGISDSVASWRILHTDLQGVPINSALNNQLLMVGKTLGLIRFFQVDSFPQVLQPLVLLGNAHPDAGLIRLTYGMIYDHQPGDVIQYYDSWNRPYGPPWENYERYITHTFLARTEDDETLSYSVGRRVFYQDSLEVIVDTIQLQYQKNEVFRESPYDNSNTFGFLMRSALFYSNYFGFDCWTYQEEPEHLIYCSEENCWGPYDTQGPPEETTVIHAIGLGETVNRGWMFGFPPSGYSYNKHIVYFIKNGIPYGNEVIVGTNHKPYPGVGIGLFPNPAGDQLFLKTELPVNARVLIYEMNGQLVQTNTLEYSQNEIDISQLPAGLYLVKVMDNRNVYIDKFIKR